MSLTRVNKKNPCPVCRRIDWCMVGKDDALCMRVQSSRQHTLKDGSYGWWHQLDSPVRFRPALRAPEKPARINASHVLRQLADSGRHEIRVVSLALSLGVKVNALDRLGCVAVRDRSDTFAFPMSDGNGIPVGIRLRSNDGSKWAVAGSQSGLFMPRGDPEETAMICEGPTDTAAALSLGYYALGRPSCNGALDFILRAVDRLRIRRVIIVVDNDEPGVRGAQILQSQLRVPSCMLLCPAKDIRQFLNHGGTKAALDSIAGSLVWKQPKETHDLQHPDRARLLHGVRPALP